MLNSRDNQGVTAHKRRVFYLVATVALGVCAVLVPALAQTVDLYNNTNTGGVNNRPKGKTAFALNRAAQITELVTYHWNNGRGAKPGTIGLRASNGRIFGPFQARGTSGQNNAPNVNWLASVNMTLPAGNYVVLDSDPATWSQNAQSAYRGFVIVRGRYLGRPGPRPTPAPTPAPAPAIPKPCHATTNALVELVPPCFGPPGTLIKLVVVRTLKTPLAGVVFKPGPIGAGAGLRTPPPNMAVTVLSGPTGSNGLVLLSGNGTAPGSVYQLPAPPSLCMPGKGNWTWDIWMLWPGGKLQGDIDDFTVQGC